MNDFNGNALEAQLQQLSDCELASLIIEFAESDEVGIALGQETLNRLNSLRLKQNFDRVRQQPALS